MAGFRTRLFNAGAKLTVNVRIVKVKLVTVLKGKSIKTSAGGMTIVPDVNLYDLDIANAAALVLIGGILGWIMSKI